MSVVVRFCPSVFTLALCATFSKPVLAASSPAIPADKQHNTLIDAADTERSIERIQIKGSRITAERIRIEQDELEKRQARDLKEMFQGQSALSVGGSLGVAQKLYLHGIEELLLNVALDGAVQSGSMFHHIGRLTLEPELVRAIEVQAGPGDATQGAGALGGSVDFISKDASDLLTGDDRFSALSKFAYGSNNDLKKYHLTLAGKLSEQWELLGSSSKQDSGLFKDADGQAYQGTASEQQFHFAKLTGELAAGHQLRYSFEQARDEGIRPQRPNWQVSSWNRAFPLETQRNTHNLNYTFDPASQLVDGSLSVYHSNTELEQNARFGLYHGGVQNEGFDLRNTSLLGDHRLVYGVDYRAEATELFPVGVANGRRDNEDASVKGLYLQDYYNLTPTLRINAGARFDDYQVRDMKGQRLSSDGVSPNLGVSLQLSDHWRLFTGYSSALRGRLTTNSFVLDNRSNAANLKAEQAHHRQIGAEFISAGWHFNANLFDTLFEDVIGEKSRVYQNLGDLENRGYDLKLSYRTGSFSVGGSVAKANPKINGAVLNPYDHGGLGTNTGRQWSLFGNWQPADEWQTGLSLRVAEGQRDLTTSAGLIQQPGYGVWDAYLQYSPAQLDALRLTLGVKNLLDKQYRDQATLGDFNHIPDYEGLVGMPEPGRDIRAELRWQF